MESIATALFKYSPRQFAQGELTRSPVLPPALLAVLLLAALVVVVISARGLTLARRDRILLGCLRATAFVVLAICLLRPSLVLSRAVPQRNVLAIVLDDSRSMRLPDVAGQTRLAAVRRTFADSTALVRQLADKFVLRFFRFAGNSGPISGAAALTATGTRTDLGAAVANVRTELADLPLAGVVMVTDGADNAAGDLEAPLLGYRARKVPIYTVGVGSERFTRDVGVERFSLPSSTLLGGGVEAEVLLSARNIAGDTIRVAVEADGRMVASEVAVVPSGRDVFPVALRVPPLPAGLHRIAVHALPIRGEVITQNNSADATLRVRPATEKVLYIEGEPRPEFAFLRRAIAGDSGVQLVGLLQSAKGKYLRLGVDDSLELRDGFPTRREELFRYRVIVLGSVEASFFTGDQLRMLGDFVSHRGGTIIALGGRGSFAEGGWNGTPLADVLPIAFDTRGPRIADTAVVELTVHPTAAGAVHPALRLGATAASLRRWDSLPQLSAVNRFGPPREGATVLLSGKPANGPEIPVLVIERYGRGMAAVLGIQDSWRWQMSPRLPVEDQSHQLLWRQLLRWSLDQVPERVEVTVTPDHVDPGQPVSIRARVSDAGYFDLNDAVVTAQVTDPSGAIRDVPLEWTLHDDGSYAGQVVAERLGQYQVTVTARRGADTMRSSATALLADTTGADVGRAELRTGVLTRLAEATGGRYYPLNDVSRLVHDVEFTSAGIAARDAHDLWDMPIVLILLVLLLGAEWGFRRYRGLA
ncbi:MAG: hypothetical protein ABIZ70_14090 [Gemmatimonadales bacterium]